MKETLRRNDLKLKGITLYVIVVSFLLVLTGCDINIHMDFYKYAAPRKEEVAGTYRYHNKFWKGPMYILKLEKDGRYTESVITNGNESIVKQGEWNYENNAATDAESGLIQVKTFKDKKLSSTFEMTIQKRKKDGKLFIFGVHSISNEWYERVN